MFMSIVRSRNPRIYSIHTQFQQSLRNDHLDTDKSKNLTKETAKETDSTPQNPSTIIVKGSRWSTSVPRTACGVLI